MIFERILGWIDGLGLKTFGRLRIQVMSKAAVERYACSSPHIVISIRTPEAPQARFPENPNRKGVLKLDFHDFTGEESNLRGDLLDLFSVSHALRIKEFVTQHPGIKTIICHCEGGMSRSAGVAAALSRHFNGDDRFYFKKYYPNKLVYKTLLEALGKKQ